jgi:hypothetical protein
LTDYYSTNFTLVNRYNWSVSEIENLIPWEREIYINLLLANEEKKKQEIAQYQSSKDFRI